VVLGSTLLVRSDGSSLTGATDVHQLWGPPTEQSQPTASYVTSRVVDDVRTVTGPDGIARRIIEQRTEQETHNLPLVRTDVAVELALEHRKRGLQWYPTYTVDLEGRYTFRNDTEEARTVSVAYPLSRGIGMGGDWSGSRAGTGSTTVFDNFAVRDGSGQAVVFTIASERAQWTVEIPPGGERTYEVAYRGRGTERWQYRMADGAARVENFALAVHTDFGDVDFPDGTLSPTTHGASSDGGWAGTWSFESSIANRPVGVEMPTRLNPGPLAARITFFAPVGLLFFFFVVGILAMAREQDLHPMHYFFLGCSFFAFHLLFAYLVDHLPIAASFAVSAAVSMSLALSYTRLFTSWRFTIQFVGVSQVLYLVLFSYTFMWEGFTGLAITVGAIVTLFVMMQITGRRRWGAQAKVDDPAAQTRAPTTGEAVLDAKPKAF